MGRFDFPSTPLWCDMPNTEKLYFIITCSSKKSIELLNFLNLSWSKILKNCRLDLSSYKLGFTLINLLITFGKEHENERNHVLTTFVWCTTFIKRAIDVWIWSAGYCIVTAGTYGCQNIQAAPASDWMQALFLQECLAQLLQQKSHEKLTVVELDSAEKATHRKKFQPNPQAFWKFNLWEASLTVRSPLWAPYLPAISGDI